MIFYFSGTGNSTFVAEHLAKAYNHEAIRVDEWLHTGRINFNIDDQDRIGFVFPVYFYGLPHIVEQFLLELSITFEKKPYVYYIAICGGQQGQSIKKANAILQKKGLGIDAAFDLLMPDNYTRMYDVNDDQKIMQINQHAIIELKEIMHKIEQKEVGHFAKTGFPRILSAPVTWFGQTFLTKTKGFHVLDSCIHCALCERKCPVHAIELIDGKPVWQKKKCEMCLRCLHHCPKFAIQYKNQTQENGQYHHPVI
ncbi:MULTISPECIES: EFR1 family ferrodoxin [unclassified Breznakia]|uniref:EFR1 family ferrodoxin n=1 Tax=unclassified Breznakia TaxID=2623764 RepID=UPI002475D6F0|nr:MULTISPECIES: EFR1 family ferrodoxin [unclassified Breznakia]MDH6368077.1 ferredoxin [Breznakia sp. PH1-1]MDH6405162.1 ferredoxin [Breznakia sp. PF1-11]MDH6412880.1 ferredoxin [Breznakia sp. PFB1-11]MDH6415238.1 ferredoxin [Breznakia sp. PFB1-14]MDH6417548.1 ferredoxin [Breznakia sp. PFB1-4]